jgi:hypothetical protein
MVSIPISTAVFEKARKGLEREVMFYANVINHDGPESTGVTVADNDVAAYLTGTTVYELFGL